MMALSFLSACLVSTATCCAPAPTVSDSVSPLQFATSPVASVARLIAADSPAFDLVIKKKTPPTTKKPPVTPPGGQGIRPGRIPPINPGGPNTGPGGGGPTS